MNDNFDNRFEEVVESSCGNDCGCDRDRDFGCDGHDDRCGCTRKEYLGKSVTETRYFRVKTKRFIAAENNCRCGRCR